VCPPPPRSAWSPSPFRSRFTGEDIAGAGALSSPAQRSAAERGRGPPEGRGRGRRLRAWALHRSSGPASLGLHRLTEGNASANFLQAEPTKSKKNQEKTTWISLDFFVRFGAFQRVMSNPRKKAMPMVCRRRQGGTASSTEAGNSTFSFRTLKGHIWNKLGTLAREIFPRAGLPACARRILVYKQGLGEHECLSQSLTRKSMRDCRAFATSGGWTRNEGTSGL
jgi:hypothetical protein